MFPTKTWAHTTLSPPPHPATSYFNRDIHTRFVSHSGFPYDNYKRVIGTTQPMVMPINILERNLNKKMSLLLKDGRVLEGVLIGFDEYMNMVLDNTQETKDDIVKKMGKVILRGNNVVTIVPA